MSDYSFRPVEFKSAKRSVKSPIAASVHKTCPTRVVFRITAEVAKRAKIQPGMLLTPFLDPEHRALLLIEGQRPIPDSARKLYATTGKAIVVEFPRTDAFAQIFPGPMLAIGLDLKECSQGRIVAVIPKINPEK